MGQLQKTLFQKKAWLMENIMAVWKTGLNIDEEKLIAHFCNKFITTRRNALGLLRELELIGNIKRINKEIVKP